jgi:hypothetical protein
LLPLYPKNFKRSQKKHYFVLETSLQLILDFFFFLLTTNQNGLDLSLEIIRDIRVKYSAANLIIKFQKKIFSNDIHV